MTIAIARRKFIALLGVAGSWPLAARAQQTGSPVIGFLSSVDPVSMEKPVSAFHQGLDHMGFIDGRNVTVTYEWAKNQYDRLPALTQALVRQGVSVIVTSGGEPAAFAAKAATKTIPIVFNTNGDPVRLGLATDLRRPGGNLTGISGLETTAVVAKRFNLLRELLPKCQLFGLLANAKNVNTEADISEARADAQSKRQQLVVETVSDARNLDEAFAALAQQRVGGDACAKRSIFHVIEGCSCRAGGALRYSCDLRAARDCRCWRSHYLRLAPRQLILAPRCLCWPNSQGREARRDAHHTADQV